MGWKQFCSGECLKRDRIVGVNVVCRNCDKEFIRSASWILKSKLGHSFCSQHCAATYNNQRRADALPVKLCKNPNCNNRIVNWSIHCSLSCAGKSRRRGLSVLKEEVLLEIRNFYTANQRIPVKREMYSAYKKARRSFGAWNKAIATAGFQPNPVMFANKYIAKDGHRCDSLAEKIIDEWFRLKNIVHQRSVPYPEHSRMTCDFTVQDFYIEFFGLGGQHRRYDELINKKRELSKKHGIKLVELKPDDLFPKNQLDRTLSFLLESKTEL